MDLKELNNLDFSTIGDWPPLAKGILILFLCGALVGGWYWFVTLDQLDRLALAETQETELRATFESKQRLAANLETHREQLAQMEEFLQDLLRQLPGSAEIAALLVDVSQTGLAAGLEFELFQPTAEVSKSFYAELPIQVEVKGSYHQLGTFVSGLAALPRIVTVHDVTIASADKESRVTTPNPPPTVAGRLSMRATVKTYRYLDDSELAQEQGAKKGAKGGKSGGQGAIPAPGAQGKPAGKQAPAKP